MVERLRRDHGLAPRAREHLHLPADPAPDIERRDAGRAAGARRHRRHRRHLRARSGGSGPSRTSPRSSATSPRGRAGSSGRGPRWPRLHERRAQAAAWRAADGLAVPRLAPLSRDALRVWGVDAAGEAAIRATCASFVRVSPVNLVLSGLLRRPPDAASARRARPAPRPPGRRRRRSDRCPRSPIPPPCPRRSGRCWRRSAPPWPASPSSPASTGCSAPGRASSPTWRPCCGPHAATTRRPARPASGSWPRWTRRSPRSSPRCRRCPPPAASRPPPSSRRCWPRSTPIGRRVPEMVVFGRMLGDALPQP